MLDISFNIKNYFSLQKKCILTIAFLNSGEKYKYKFCDYCENDGPPMNTIFNSFFNFYFLELSMHTTYKLNNVLSTCMTWAIKSSGKKHFGMNNLGRFYLHKQMYISIFLFNFWLSSLKWTDLIEFTTSYVFFFCVFFSYFYPLCGTLTLYGPI